MIEIAKSAGFCFGVRRATSTVEALINEGRGNEIFILGKLIHNEQYNDFLAKNGVRSISSSDLEGLYKMAQSGQNITVVIRTHGVEKQISELLNAYSDKINVCDLTCPYVKKIHKIVDENSNDAITIVIGKAEHPEVKSIVSYARGEAYVFENAELLENNLKQITNSDKTTDPGIIMVAQTTQKLTEWEKCQKIIKKYCTNAKIFDTICSVTEIRQTEASELSARCDVMLVVGGRESSNTAKLTQVCLANCERTYQIETADELSIVKSGHENNIGITAGASTPDCIIQEVKKKMSEIMENENFEQMLNEQMAKKQKIYVGATVKGIVYAIDKNEIRLDLGDKLTGVITRDQITDSNDVDLNELFKIGDEVEATVLEKSDVDGTAILSKKKVDTVKNWSKIVELAESGEIVVAKITDVTKGGVVADVYGVRVFIPASMSGVAKGESLDALKGTEQEIKITEIKAEKKSAIGSIKAVLREKKKAAAEEFWNSLEVGMEFEGPIKSVVSYGVFVDLGAVDGLVHITELSWKRIKHPSEVVSVGQIIKVFVKSVDKENKRVSLGYKTDDQNPWNIFKSQYSVGSVASVKIVGITSFGAFAEIVAGVDGLIHISQIADQKIDSVANVLKVGDVVDAQIMEIDDEKQKVSLSIRALLPKEEATEEAVEEAPAEETAEEATDAE
jgi:4-hydroxy-3-methylbut-2-enyl diphosphate reductase